MDTKWKKWKNRKKGISFLIFFLGVSLTLGSLTHILGRKPSGVRLCELDKLLADDYQESARFRSYMEGRLEDFLVMATGGEGLWGVWGYEDGAYYGEGYGRRYYDEYGYSESLSEAFQAEVLQQEQTDSAASSLSAEELTGYLESLNEMQAAYLQLLDAMSEAQDPESKEAFRSELEIYENEMRNLIEEMGSDLPGRLSAGKIKPLTEEQRQKIAEKYHDNIKGDKNLLYSIAYDGKVLYSNCDLLGEASGGDKVQTPEDGKEQPSEEDKDQIQGGKEGDSGKITSGCKILTGSSIATAYGDVTLPDGYNFLLYFDGERAWILKDGREVHIYGDGYYREGNDWYLPGYANFQTDDTAKKAAICMAVAKEPVLYMEGSYRKGSSMQYDNSLYWMNQEVRTRSKSLYQGFVGLAVGIILLFVSFFLRKARKQAEEGIARFQAKIWLECKIMLLLGLLYGLYMLCIFCLVEGSGYSLWEEAVYAYDYNLDLSAAAWLGREMLGRIPPTFWVALFWGAWLVWNDLRHNKKMWRRSLTARICQTFSAKSLGQPLSRKMTRRSRNLFLAALIYALLMLEEIMLIDTVWSGGNARMIVLLVAALETLAFLALLYLTGKKNVKAAREVEALSCRITEIRNGDYKEESGRFAACAGDGSPESHGVRDGSIHDLQPIMAQLEDIRHGMARAVDEQMKSERMKVELIANVSHDIKTPLTSIISYVELLKQEENLPDYVKDYVKILDEKSQRLKNMIADVFAVSKAASGELPISMEELDFGKLLRQTLADMEEQIRDSAVTFRTQIPDTPVMILADGQRLYRVFQNLFENALKYSLQGSRVYITLRTDGQLAVVSVKNTSSQELEKGKDFVERFARGDKSRTDGGSGLGLSIAQSFTEACGGEFSWETDADLFVVKVTFRILAAQSLPEETEK